MLTMKILLFFKQAISCMCLWMYTADKRKLSLGLYLSLTLILILSMNISYQMCTKKTYQNITYKFITNTKLTKTDSEEWWSTYLYNVICFDCLRYSVIALRWPFVLEFKIPLCHIDGPGKFVSLHLIVDLLNRNAIFLAPRDKMDW